ncbi:hypothetical protein RHMOL_Rhmol06G0025600 [Rhododendron molle]|uniref:Uncharacterized protein n=1 Tax=Rhododendron molle TaxID=49168 RepID=A0ACC0N8X0_RHOML|nr:hypothetical protein RHMOL_Rhmol06G0025600 [Rhododendron molle]
MAQTTPNHTQTVSGWAAHDSSGKITPYTFKRRENGMNDVTIKVLYCGICHTDLHHVRNDWGITMYPVVPGHEITGLITKVGSNVTEFKVGDRVGVGCLAASCLECEFCKDSQENYCDQIQFTYNGIFWDGSITYGGYSKMLVADQRYVVHVPENLPMDAAAPLLCAGVTVFCPFKDNNMLEAPGKKIGVIGLGGLGHVAVKFGKAFGHHVTVISTSPSKEEEAKDRLGADDFIVSTDAAQMKVCYLLTIYSTSYVSYCTEIKTKEVSFDCLDLVVDRQGRGKRVVKGSMTGSMKETQEMMDVCGKYNITCDIETIPPEKINEALDRLAKNDVKYRFVIDIDAQKPASL